LGCVAPDEFGLVILAKDAEFEVESLQLSLNLFDQCESVLEDEFYKVEPQDILFFSDSSLGDCPEPDRAVQVYGLVD
jgi:hypothetical protein